MKLETVRNSSIQQEIIPGEIDAGYLELYTYVIPRIYIHSGYSRRQFLFFPSLLLLLPFSPASDIYIYSCPLLDKSTQSTLGRPVERLSNDTAR